MKGFQSGKEWGRVYTNRAFFYPERVGSVFEYENVYLKRRILKNNLKIVKVYLKWILYINLDAEELIKQDMDAFATTFSHPNISFIQTQKSFILLLF